MIYRRFCINQSNSSTYACACRYAFSVYWPIDVHIIYLCCEYQLIWSQNEWFIGLLVLANAIQVHVHARADGQVDPIDQLSVSIYTFNINIKQIQWKTMKLKFFELYPNLTYLYAHTCMHVYANYFENAVQLEIPISIYRINLN
jgi:hypothetical protein